MIAYVAFYWVAWFSKKYNRFTEITLAVVIGAWLLTYLIFVDKNRLPDEEGDTLAQKKTKRGVYILAAAIGILICFIGWTNALYTGFTGS